MEGISVIVPIYNAEKTLNVCLDSIYNQDYKKLEIILVDDGSTDNSPAIVDEYKEKYALYYATKVIHKKNEGLMNARVTGIKKSKYDYVAFVDADDWIEMNHIRDMAEKINSDDVDVVLEGCALHENGMTEIKNNLFPNGVYIHSEIQNILYRKMLCYNEFFSFGLLPYMWNKLFKKCILEECYKNLDTSVDDGEDVLTFFSYMLNVKKLIIGNAHTYHYCLSEMSMTKNHKNNYLNNVSKLYLNLDSIFSNSDFYPVLKPQLDQYMRMMVKKSAPEKYISDEEHYFPFLEIPRNTRIIIYGAGLVGKKYVHQLLRSRYCELAAWVDQAFSRIESFEGISISSPECIRDIKYDYILVAIADRIEAGNIKEYLSQRYKVPYEKIFL